MKRTDVFVVGGGPAGLMTAIALCQKGFDVTVADASHPPIDKTCGEGLMPGAIAALRQMGVELDPAQGAPFQGIRFLGENISVESDFALGQGLGVRRTVLHQALVTRAAACGVNLLWGAAVRSFNEKAVVLDDGAIAYRWLVGADGENSRVRRWAGLDFAWNESRRFGFRKHYRVSPWASHTEVYWGAGCQIYITPVSADEICIAVMSRDPHLRIDCALREFPGLAQRLLRSQAVGSEHGAVSATRRLRRVYKGRVALVGDASGSVDAITGEGLRLSFEQSLALADALAEGDLRAYQVQHERLTSRPSMMGRMLLTLDRSRLLRRRVLRAFAAEPKLFSKLLAIHSGCLSTAELVWEGMIPLTRGILTA